MRKAGSVVRQVGFLCDNNRLIVTIDDTPLMLSLLLKGNIVISDISKFNGDDGQCIEVDVDVDVLYDAKYFPRTYYTIYKLSIDGVGDVKNHLLEKYDGSRGATYFYVCGDLDECQHYIEELEGE